MIKLKSLLFTGITNFNPMHQNLIFVQEYMYLKFSGHTL